MSFLSPPHEAFSAGFYRDAEFDFAVRQTPAVRLRSYFTLLQTGRDEVPWQGS